MAPRNRPGPLVRLRSSFVFAFVIALVIGGSYIKNSKLVRPSVNEDVGVWDTEAGDAIRYTIMTRANDTGGDHYKVQLLIRPTASDFYPGKPGSSPMTILAHQSKRLLVTSGALGYELNGTQAVAAAGQVVDVPAGTPHTLWNADPASDVAAELTVTPGTPDETYYENLAGIGRQNKDLSRVNPVELIVVFAHYQVRPSEIHPLVWDLAAKVGSTLGRLMGFKTSYPQYLSRVGAPRPAAPLEHPAAAQEAAAAAEEEAAAAEEEDAWGGEAADGYEVYTGTVEMPAADGADGAEGGAAWVGAGEQQGQGGSGVASEEPLLEVDAGHMAAQ